MYAAGLISIKTVEACEVEIARAKDRVTEVAKRIANADRQIEATLTEAYKETLEYKQAVRARVRASQQSFVPATKTATLSH